MGKIVVSKPLDTRVVISGMGQFRMVYDPAKGKMTLSPLKKGAGSLTRIPEGSSSTKVKSKLSKNIKYDPTKDELGFTLKGLPDSFRLNLERALRHNRALSYTRGRIRGQLDMKSKALTNVARGSRTVYKQRDRLNKNGYNIMFLVDCSGSMAGAKMNLTNQVLLNLLPTLQKIDGVNTAVVEFQTFIRWRKFWHTKEYKQVLEGQAGNSDYDALDYAFKEGFKGAPPNCQNILIMLSDGEPSDSGLRYIADMTNGHEERIRTEEWRVSLSESSDKYLCPRIASMVQRESTRRGIKAFGIGILHGGAQIPEHKVIKNLDELEPTLIGYLRKEIR